MSKKVVIVGGGITGLCTAYYLQKAGHEVTVLDKGDLTGGASYVNAGYITPSHIIPLASPGMITQGLRWMFNSSSPFYMKPRWDMDFFKWAWQFYKASTPEHVQRSIPVIKESNILSRELFSEIKASGDLGEFHLERKGLLMLYQTEKEGEHEWEVAQKAKFLGLDVKQLKPTEIKTYEPSISINAKGAVFYECDGHTSPPEFMAKMITYLRSMGVGLITGEEVVDITKEGQKVTKVITKSSFYKADEVVIAAGSWSQGLLKKLKVNMPLQGGKGYSINLERETGITMPAILMEAKVAVTPMTHGTRFAGTMEFSGINKVIRPKRVESIAAAGERFYEGLKIGKNEKGKASSGLRPVSPDGMPYIGKLSSYTNITVATGHAMMGWSLGPVTGKLICEVIQGEKPCMDMTAFDPDRYA